MRDISNPLSAPKEFNKPHSEETKPSKLEQAMEMSKYYTNKEDPYELWDKKVCLMDLRKKIIGLINILKLTDIDYIIDSYQLNPRAACNLLTADKYILIILLDQLILYIKNNGMML